MAFRVSQQVVKLTASTWTRIELEDLIGDALVRNQGIENDGRSECEVWLYITLDPDLTPSDTSDAIHLSLDQNFTFSLTSGLFLWAYSETENASLLILQGGREANETV